jgi:PKHD-type hydroxylase
VLLTIPQVLSKEQVTCCRRVMDAAEWVDGRGTAGAQSGSVKHNMQLPQTSPAAEQLGARFWRRSPARLYSFLPQFP